MTESVLQKVRRIQTGDLVLVTIPEDRIGAGAEFIAQLVSDGHVPEGAVITIMPEGLQMEVLSLEEMSRLVEELSESLALLKECMKDTFTGESIA